MKFFVTLCFGFLGLAFADEMSTKAPLAMQGEPLCK